MVALRYHVVIVILAGVASMWGLSCGPRVTAKDARLARVFLDTAKSNVYNGEFVDAEMEARKSIDRDPTNAEAYRILALSYFGQQKLRGAILEIKRALDLQPKNGDFHNDLGGFYLADNQVTEARGEFQLALEDRSFSAPAAALYNIGETYRLQGDDDRASLKYQEALDRDPNQDRPYFRLGEIALKRGKEDDAVKLMQDAIKMNPYNFDALKELCLISCSRREVSKAEQYCNRFLEIKPESFNYSQDVINRIRQCLYDVR